MAVEFLTVVYRLGADEGFGTDFVWESMYFWTEGGIKVHYFLLTAFFFPTPTKTFVMISQNIDVCALSSHSLIMVMSTLLTICLHKSAHLHPRPRPGMRKRRRKSDMTASARARRPSCEPAHADKHCNNEMLIHVSDAK